MDKIFKYLGPWCTWDLNTKDLNGQIEAALVFPPLLTRVPQPQVSGHCLWTKYYSVLCWALEICVIKNILCFNNWYEDIQFHLQWRTGRTCLQYGGWYSTSRHCRHTWTLWWHKVNEFDELRRLKDDFNEYLKVVVITWI